MASKIPGKESDRYFCSNCGFPCKDRRDPKGSYGESGWNFASGANASSASNQVSNGTFTTATTGWTGVAGTLSVASGGQSGKCLTITRTSGDEQYAYQELSSLEVGVLYRLLAYVKAGTSGNEDFILRVMDADRSRTIYSATGTASSTWTAYSCLWRAFSYGANVICLVKNSSTAGTMLFDTVTVYEYEYSVSEELPGCPLCGSRNWKR